jgi:hypothetical protein
VNATPTEGDHVSFVPDGIALDLIVEGFRKNPELGFARFHATKWSDDAQSRRVIDMLVEYRLVPDCMMCFAMNKTECHCYEEDLDECYRELRSTVITYERYFDDMFNRTDVDWRPSNELPIVEEDPDFETSDSLLDSLYMASLHRSRY